MDVGEPRARHRGFFLHSDTVGETEAGEHENPEGIKVRLPSSQSPKTRRSFGGGSVAVGRLAFSRGGRSRSQSSSDESLPQIRSGSVTGSRQRAHLPR